MSALHEIQYAFRQVGFGLRRPEELTVAWRDRANGSGPRPSIFPVFLFTAIAGLAAYGLTMGLSDGVAGMLEKAVKAPLAAGLAWTIALPSLYVVNVALGSKLDASTTLLAALATVSFGALAMLASVPVSWFFAVAFEHPWIHLVAHLMVFTGVGICMVDVFIRVMKALEPERSQLFALVWLTLVACLGVELMSLLHLFAVER